MGDARIPDRSCVGPFAFPVKWTTTVRINADLIEPGSNPQIWSETVDRAQKEQLVDELGQIFESSGVVVVSHYAGLTVANMQDLRAKASVAAAKVAEDFSKDNDNFVILGGAMGENALDRAGVTAVSKMPSRDELIATIVGMLGAPASNIAGAIGAPASNIASILSTIEDKAAA